MKAMVGLATALTLVMVGSALDARRDIESQYRTWVKAALSLDAERVAALLTPDYEIVTYTNKHILRDAYLQSIRDKKSKNEMPQRYTQKIVKFQLVGEIATVESHETSDLWLENPITNKKEKFEHVHVYDDTWVRNPEGWRLQKTVTKDEITRPIRRVRSST